MDFTEQTIMQFFRQVGQPSAAYRLMDFLRTEGLLLVPESADGADLEVEMAAMRTNVKKAKP